MFIIYGSRATHLKSVTSETAVCPHCASTGMNILAQGEKVVLRHNMRNNVMQCQKNPFKNFTGKAIFMLLLEKSDKN
jgi:hypothetical protein